MKIRQLLEENKKLISHIEDDYKPQYDVFTEDDADMTRLKEIIYSELNDIERRVFILYTELGSVCETARLLKISPSSITVYLKKIRKKILDHYVV